LSHPTDFLGLPVVSSWEPSGFARTVFAGRVKSRQANDRECSATVTQPLDNEIMTTTPRNTNMECLPPAGHTYLTIGQDLFSIQEYLDSQYNASLHRNSTTPRGALAPAATMVYTDIQTLRGLDSPVDYGSGIEYANGLLDSVFVGQDVGLQIGLWLNGTRGCLDMVQGKLDDEIYRLMKYLEHCQASRIFLRVGYGKCLCDYSLVCN